ncbi:uncharacterized protein [Oscarella lobularis]|uniref:uncharacterized protein n=1 Tax=Oscarella lobularis TaxID=121494 RepID=UPI0033131FB8
MEAESPKPKLKPTPVNWRVVLVSFTILSATATTVTMVFPFLPWMVRKFRINGEFVQEEESGYYAGVVASSYFFGRFFGCYFWGIFSDKKGRRRTILISGSAIAIFNLSFGFTNTHLGLAWAMTTRVLSGASNGLLGASKAAIADVSDNTNQAKGMAYVTAAWGMGLVAGQALGGLLAEPVRQYPGVFPRGFLETFPYFLPSAVTTFFLILGLVLVYFLLPETLDNGSYTLVSVGDVAERNDDDGISSENNRVQKTTRTIDETESEPAVSYSTTNGVAMEFRDRKGQGGRRRSSVGEAIKKTTLWSILRHREARLALATYCIFSFSVIGSDELISLWMATKQYRGGLSFSEKEIGISQSVLAAVLVPLQIIFAHRIEKKLGSLTAFYATCTVCAFFIAALPVVSSIENTVLLWTVLFINLFLMRFCIVVAFVMISIFINNAMPKSRFGAINGLAISLTAFTRTLAPSFGGSLFAWCISWGAKRIGFPFDYHLVFYLFSIVYLIALLLSVKLPNSLQKQKNE